MLPILYGKSSTGKAKLWSIEAKGGEIITTFGYVDGEKQVTRRTVEAKNVGKKNETSLQEQAEKEALSKWKRKKKSGYSEEQDELDPASNGYFKPWAMLAHEFKARGHNIIYPALVQPKLDGFRVMYDGNSQQFWTREGEVKKYAHIEEELRAFGNVILDGEIYSDFLQFEKIVGLDHKKYKTNQDMADMQQLKYYVFDLISEAPFIERYKVLKNLFKGHTWKHLVLVQVYEVDDALAVEQYMAKFVQIGFEGVMIRNKEAPYKRGYRSADLQKLKPFCEDEFEIVGFKEGKGKYKGCVIWQCKADAGLFYAKPRGSEMDNSLMFDRAGEYIGKPLTIKYQGLTRKGIPRFPVAKAIRWEK